MYTQHYNNYLQYDETREEDKSRGKPCIFEGQAVKIEIKHLWYT